MEKKSDRFNSKLGTFESLGMIRLMQILFQNEDAPFSKYELQQKLDLSLRTLNKRITYLKKCGLIEENLDIGPRKRTEIALTEKGQSFSSKLDELENLLK